jgi:hypothetical protein
MDRTDRYLKNDKWNPYKNVSGKSGVSKFLIGEDYIQVVFKESADIYVYNYEVTEKAYVEQMKKLAKNGEGLSGFTSQKVRDKYASD